MTTAAAFDAVVPANAPHGWPGALTLTVPTGRFAVIRTGTANAGALLRLCTGQVAPSTGRVEVLDVEPAMLSRRHALRFRRRLGVAFDPPALVSNLTLRMNLVVPILYGDRAKHADAVARTDALLESAGLTAWASSRPADVPPDVRLETSVLRALAVEPELLLLEHPTDSLPPERATALLDRCRRTAPTVVVATPEWDETLAAFADMTAVWDEHGIRYANDEVGIG